jgi:hypothetical protein
MKRTWDKPKLLRAAQLFLVLLVAFGRPFYHSLMLFLNKGQSINAQNSNPHVLKFVFMLSVVFQLIGLALLVFILRRRGRTLSDLGFSFRWRDISHSIGLLFVALILSTLVRLMMFYGSYFMTGRVLDISAKNVYFMQTGAGLPLLLYVFINSFHEELIARAYAINEVEYLTGGTVTAAVFSILLQTSYHLYQGIPSALSVAFIFAFFSLYYVRRRRVLPLILAHLYLDLLAVVAYAMR